MHRAVHWLVCLIVLQLCTAQLGAQETNTLCPVMTDEPADPTITTVYRGKEVRLCCDMCLEKFDRDPEKYVSRLPQFAVALSAEPTELSDASDDVPWLGRVHPILVHFPIACIPAALLAFLLSCTKWRITFNNADVIPLLMGSLIGIAAYVTGDIGEEHMRFSERMHDIVEQHERAATFSLVLCLQLCVIRLWRWGRMTRRWQVFYGIGLLAACCLLGITGFHGGSLVFGPDHLSLN